MITMGRIYRKERLLVLSRWYVDIQSEVLGYSELRARRSSIEVSMV